MADRIVHLIGQSSRGGAERQLFLLSTALNKRGWPQSVVSFDVGGVWKERLESAGLPVHEIPRCRFKPWRLWQLSRILRRERPAILQVWSPHVGPYARWAWGKGGARTVVGVRSNLTFNTHTGKPVDRIPFIGSFVHADCAVSNSQGALDDLARRGIKLPRAKVIGNIVEPNGRADAAQPAATPRIVSAGRLDILKGHDCLLRAAAILAAERKPFELLLVGEGPERDALESLASELNLRHCVRFLGPVDGVSDLMAAAHVLAHPSKHEGLSNTILEGMAEGLPVVSTIECASEIIEDGRTGLLVPAGQPKELADALRRLLDDPPLRGRLGAAALRHVQQYCNADLIAEQYENLYHSLLATGLSRAACSR